MMLLSAQEEAASVQVRHCGRDLVEYRCQRVTSQREPSGKGTCTQLSVFLHFPPWRVTRGQGAGLGVGWTAARR